jgi:hypothetical protein
LLSTIIEPQPHNTTAARSQHQAPSSKQPRAEKQKAVAAREKRDDGKERGNHTFLLCWERVAAAAPEEEEPREEEAGRRGKDAGGGGEDLAEEHLRGESSSLSNQSNWSDWLVPPCSLSFPLNSRPQFLLFPLQFGFPLRLMCFPLDQTRASQIAQSDDLDA